MLLGTSPIADLPIAGLPVTVIIPPAPLICDCSIPNRATACFSVVASPEEFTSNRVPCRRDLVGGALLGRKSIRVRGKICN